MNHLKKIIPVLLAGLAIVLTGCGDQIHINEHMDYPIAVEEKVPDFQMEALMPDDSIQDVQLSDYEGQWVMLFFYPKDFTHVCPTELRELVSYREKFEELGVVVLPVSTDSSESHKDWRAEVGGEAFNFPWISDDDGEIARMFNIYKYEDDIALRGTFVIDPYGVLQAQIINNQMVGRSIPEHIRTIEALQTGGLCSATWEPGDETIDPNAAEDTVE